MPIVVPVKFAYASRDLWFDPQGLDIVEGDHAICSTERGTEIGLVTADPFEVTEDELAAPLKPVVRIADDHDIDRADELARKGEAAMADFRRLVKANELEMKPVGVEYLFGGEKAIFYFAAEERVDFRQLVKDLSSCLHTRVDMRQIGVRDETRLVGGFAHCGQELCCTRFGGQFEPVSIRMAKEQDLPLNSAKISGVCGRLMCCLRYEFEAYKDFKGRAPKKKAVIDTPLGKARIQEYDTPREQLVLRLESGKVFRVSLSDMTCSEAAKKKSAEQGCACRPDCVSRSVLERIESPDIALALMELDRENGVDVGDGLDQADRLMVSGPTPRKRRSQEQRSGEAGGRVQKASGAKRSGAAPAAEAEGPATSGRKRRKRTVAADASPERPASRRPEKDSAQPTRRRRRHLSSEEREDAFRAAAAKELTRGNAAGAKDASTESPSGKPRRRKHIAAPSQKPSVPSVADQVASGDIQVTRRRPGDGGGKPHAEGGRARSEHRERVAREGQGARTERDARPGRAQRAEAAESAEATSAKRKRRRRSRKPRTGEGGANTPRQNDGASE